MCVRGRSGDRPRKQSAADRNLLCIVLCMLCVPVIAGALASCSGGSGSAVLPSRTTSPVSSPQPGSTPVTTSSETPSIAQWSNGSAYAPASITVSLPAAPAVGHVLVVAFWNNGQTDGEANTYTPPAGWTLADQNAPPYETYQVFWHVVGAGETDGYVFVPRAPQRQHAWIAADVGNASAVERGASLFINNSSNYTTPGITPSAAGDLAIAFNLPFSANLTWTNPDGWGVETGPTSTWSGEAVYRALSSTASISESSALSAPATGFSGIVLISPPAAGPTPAPTSAPQAVDWSTFGYDLQRTGYNPDEKTIGTGSFASMHPMAFGLPNVGAFMLGEPVVAMNVGVSGVKRNLLYDGSQNGMFYALDADTGAVVWSAQLGSSIYSCDAWMSSWGVGGTATLDRPRNRIYVSDGQNLVHALDLATGAEAPGWPVAIAPAPGHDFIHAALTYNPANGLLYAETTSRCDIGPWYGRISSIDTAGATITATFYPDQGTTGGSIWGFGGASIDPATNNVFVATGNSEQAPQNAYYSEQIIELSADLRTVIAHNYPSLPTNPDSDFGATPMLFQPPGCPPLLAAINKSGAFVLYNRDNIAAGPVETILMSIATPYGDFVGVPAYDPVTNYVYVGLPTTFDIYKPGLGAFRIRPDCTLDPAPVWNAVFGPDGAAIPDDIQRSPITIANGVVYVSGFTDDTTYAFDAATGAKLWSAPLSGTGAVGPVVVSGRLYVGDRAGTIRAWQP